MWDLFISELIHTVKNKSEEQCKKWFQSWADVNPSSVYPEFKSFDDATPKNYIPNIATHLGVNS